MPAFNFQKQFAPAVESGEKRQTIRSRRKNRPKIGQTAYLFEALRTCECRKIGEHTITSVQSVLIASKGFIINYGENGEWIESESYDLNMFAQADGFESWESMRDWFDKTHGLPFEGDLIKW